MAKKLTYESIARKRWRKATWIMGSGRWAVLAHCKMLTITLWPTLYGAKQGKRQMDEAHCCKECSGGHEIVDLGEEGV